MLSPLLAALTLRTPLAPVSVPVPVEGHTLKERAHGNLEQSKGQREPLTLTLAQEVRITVCSDERRGNAAIFWESQGQDPKQQNGARGKENG